MSNPRLEQARHHVEGGRRIVAAQEALVAQIRARGGDLEAAESLLDSFRQSLATFEDDARRLSGDSQAG